MTTRTLEEQLKEPIKLKTMFVDEEANTIKYDEEISRFLNNVEVPLTKDGKPDIKALMDKMVVGAQPIVAKYFGDGKDPAWTLTTTQLQSILDTYDNPVQDGKLRDAVRTRLTTEYRTTAENYKNQRAVARGLTAPHKGGKDYGVIVAQEANPAFVDLVKRAQTPEQLQRALGLVVPRLATNVREAYDLTGKVPSDLVKTAKQYAELYKS